MPLQYLIALFIGLPIIELAVLLKVHEVFHFWPTFILVILTGAIGLTLVKRQGIEIVQTIQQEMGKGNLPAPQMMDGVMILIAGALLITPGLITDFSGFALLVPYVRERIRFWLRDRLKAKVDSGYIQVNVKRS
ncbi:MAG: FxsA family protein [Pontiella sp.]